jgi:hypothetical protein
MLLAQQIWFKLVDLSKRHQIILDLLNILLWVLINTIISNTDVVSWVFHMILERSISCMHFKNPNAPPQACRKNSQECDYPGVAVLVQSRKNIHRYTKPLLSCHTYPFTSFNTFPNNLTLDIAILNNLRPCKFATMHLLSNLSCQNIGLFWTIKIRYPSRSFVFNMVLSPYILYHIIHFSNLKRN